MSDLLTRLAAMQRPRRTALPAADYERPMVCVRCADRVDVFEATLGATSPDEHRWLDPSVYVCGECLVGPH